MPTAICARCGYRYSGIDEAKERTHKCKDLNRTNRMGGFYRTADDYYEKRKLFAILDSANELIRRGRGAVRSRPSSDSLNSPDLNEGSETPNHTLDLTTTEDEKAKPTASRPVNDDWPRVHRTKGKSAPQMNFEGMRRSYLRQSRRRRLRVNGLLSIPILLAIGAALAVLVVNPLLPDGAQGWVADVQNKVAQLSPWS